MGGVLARGSSSRGKLEAAEDKAAAEGKEEEAVDSTTQDEEEEEAVDSTSQETSEEIGVERAAGIPVPCPDSARCKLAYLLTPPCDSKLSRPVVPGGAKAEGTLEANRTDNAGSQDAMKRPAALQVSDKVAKRPAAKAGTSQPSQVDVETAALRAELQELRELVLDHGLELPSRPTCIPGPEGKLENGAVLGIRSLACASCHKRKAVIDRVFAETKQVFCQECWTKWERSGWWRPSIRISTQPPVVRSPGGLPQFGPDDAFFLPGFLCSLEDMSLFQALKDELPTGSDFSDWHGGRHLGIQFQGEGARHDSAEAPPRLRETVTRLEETFGIRASASRLNLYRSTEDYKPLHFDRGRDEDGVPQITIGASFGATRELTMCHVQSGVTSSFPQRNGDVFAFTPELNMVFTHGVPKIGFGSPSLEEGSGPRLSLILWGAKISTNAAGRKPAHEGGKSQEASEGS